MRNEVEVSNRFGTPTVHMGLNTEPPKDYNEDNEFAKELEKTIRELFEEYDEVKLSWSCSGLTRHQMHSRQWANYLEDYELMMSDYTTQLFKDEEALMKSLGR